MLIIDPPNTAGHGRLWSHVASDTSFEELHAFAAALGIPRRGFDRDHYDIPAEWYDRAVAAGARPVTSRELVARLYAAGLRRPKAWTLAPRRPGRTLLRPPRLSPGDVVAVVAPGGPVDPDHVLAGAEVLRGWGLQVHLPAAAVHLRRDRHAGSAEQRAAELTEAWTHPEVRAVWVAGGGHTTQRVLDLLDWARLAAAVPRVLVGPSDVTALHQAVAARLGVATLHAPGVAGLADGDEVTREGTRRLLMEGSPVHLRGLPGTRAGVAEGVLVGGNLSLLATSADTPLVHPATGGIVLLDDDGQPPERLDRAVTGLLRSGWLDGVRGVALGGFASCGDAREVRGLLEERLAPLGVPVVAGVPVGHRPATLLLPLGVPARLDAEAGTLTVERFLR